MTRCRLQVKDTTRCRLQVKDMTKCRLQVKDTTRCRLQVKDTTRCRLWVKDRTKSRLQVKNTDSIASRLVLYCVFYWVLLHVLEDNQFRLKLYKIVSSNRYKHFSTLIILINSFLYCMPVSVEWDGSGTALIMCVCVCVCVCSGRITLFLRIQSTP